MKSKKYDKDIRKINDRLRSLKKTEIKYNNLKNTRMQMALEIGELASNLKKKLVKQGMEKKEINIFFKENFGKTKNRINDYIAAHRASVKKENKTRELDLSTLILLGQALGSKNIIRKKRAKQILRDKYQDKDKKKNPKKNKNKYCFEEVRTALSQIKSIPEYNHIERIKKASVYLYRYSRLLFDTIKEDGVNDEYNKQILTCINAIDSLCDKTLRHIRNTNAIITKEKRIPYPDVKSPKKVFLSIYGDDHWDYIDHDNS